MKKNNDKSKPVSDAHWRFLTESDASYVMLKHQHDFWLHLMSRCKEPTYKKQLWYIAGPFTAPTPQGIEMNVMRANIVGMKMCMLGYGVVIPHKNTDTYQYTPWGHTFWLDMDKDILRRMDGILMMRGWKDSKGAQMEYDLVQDLKKTGSKIKDVLEPEDWVPRISHQGGYHLNIDDSYDYLSILNPVTGGESKTNKLAAGEL